MAEQRSGCGTWIALIAALYIVSRCFGAHHEERSSIAPTEPIPLTQLPDSGADYSAYSSATVASDDDDHEDEEADEDADDASEVEEATEPYSSGSYIDVDGHVVSSPVFSPSAPEGASARCYDGSYSFSHHRQGTCSRHGGVAEWL